MRNYRIDVNKMLNQLIPSYMNGRKMHGFLKALFHPLDSISESFSIWAKEYIVAANMTPQVIMLEWYLNQKLKKYYKVSTDTISLNSYTMETDSIPELYSDSYVALHPQKAPALYKYTSGLNDYLYRDRTGKCSFFVRVPENNNAISLAEYKNMVQYYVGRYTLASKSFNIIVEE